MVAEIGKLPQDKVQLITLDQNEETDAITAWMKEKGLKFLVGLDKDQVAPQYKVNGFTDDIRHRPIGQDCACQGWWRRRSFPRVDASRSKAVDEAGPSNLAATHQRHSPIAQKSSILPQLPLSPSLIKLVVMQ